jgi:hypothetical protein
MMQLDSSPAPSTRTFAVTRTEIDHCRLGGIEV